MKDDMTAGAAGSVLAETLALAVPFRGEGAGRSLAAWAKALAVLAYAPGGVRFGPLTWCAAHPRSRWVEYESCPACLAEETTAKDGQAP